MGKVAKQSKDRTCRTCKETFALTARELKRHAAWCMAAKQVEDRLNAIGLVNPNLVISYPK